MRAVNFLIAASVFSTIFIGLALVPAVATSTLPGHFSSEAGQLGVGIIGVAEGLGTLGRKGMEGASNAVDGVSSAVKRLFGM